MVKCFRYRPFTSPSSEDGGNFTAIIRSRQAILIVFWRGITVPIAVWKLTRFEGQAVEISEIRRSEFDIRTIVLYNIAAFLMHIADIVHWG
jgi:hypothetical protein